jgi:hypothetical protein
MRQSRLTANWTVRISPKADQLRGELQQITGLPGNKLVELALEAFKADLEQRRTFGLDAA